MGKAHILWERTVCIQLKNNEFWMDTIYLNYSHTTKKADILNFWWYLFSSDMANNFNIKDVAYMTFYAQSHMFISFEEWIARDDFMCLKFILHDNLKINIFTSFPSFSFQLWKSGVVKRIMLLDLDCCFNTFWSKLFFQACLNSTHKFILHTH